MADHWRLAIIDFDGPVARSLHFYYGLTCETFRTYGVPSPSLHAFRNDIGTTPSSVTSFMRRRGMPKHATADDINRIRQTYMENHWREVTPTPHAKEFMEIWQRRGVPVVIVSGNEETVILQRLEEFGLLHLIQQIIATHNKEEALLNALDTFGVDAKEAFFVDDTAEGLRAAKNLGIVTIGFTGGFNTKRHLMGAKPDFPNWKYPRMDTLRQVANVLLNGR